MQGPLNLRAHGRVGSGGGKAVYHTAHPRGARRAVEGRYRARRAGGESWRIEWVGCTDNALCFVAHSRVMSCTATAAHKTAGLNTRRSLS